MRLPLTFPPRLAVQLTSRTSEALSARLVRVGVVNISSSVLDLDVHGGDITGEELSVEAPILGDLEAIQSARDQSLGLGGVCARVDLHIRIGFCRAFKPHDPRGVYVLTLSAPWVALVSDMTDLFDWGFRGREIAYQLRIAQCGEVPGQVAHLDGHHVFTGPPRVDAERVFAGRSEAADAAAPAAAIIAAGLAFTARRTRACATVLDAARSLRRPLRLRHRSISDR